MSLLCRHFAEYDSVPLPRPASAAVLEELDMHCFQDLSPDFQDSFGLFEEPMTLIGNSALHGAGVAELLCQYLSQVGQQ